MAYKPIGGFMTTENEAVKVILNKDRKTEAKTEFTPEEKTLAEDNFKIKSNITLAKSYFDKADIKSMYKLYIEALEKNKALLAAMEYMMEEYSPQLESRVDGSLARPQAINSNKAEIDAIKELAIKAMDLAAMVLESKK